MRKALLVLADGLVFEGESFGAIGESVGEVVFNTSMTGYQEILTDPSYKGQIVIMTYTQMGNYGVNSEDIESTGGPKVEGFIVKEYLDYPSNWRCHSSLDRYLEEHTIVGIQGIDTRSLTRHIRNYGAQMGVISSLDMDALKLHAKIKDHIGIGGVDLVKAVTTRERYRWSEKVWKWKDTGNIIKKNGQEKDSQLSVAVYDYGVKLNILRNLAEAGFDITVVPAQTTAEEVLAINTDGILLSNGPGDPEAVTYGIMNVKKLIGKKPVFGICLGHQIIGLALGGKTYKLKFGHHGGNHPVQDIGTGRVEITSQNHNYCVDIKSLGDQIRLTHKNLYDNTEEGMEHVEYPLFSVQHHPEAAPGPNDSSHIFQRFRDLIEKG